MNKLLQIVASPRDDASKSNILARTHIDVLRRADPDIRVDTLDLWDERLPDFDGNKAAAKMTFFGVGELDGVTRTAWDEITGITQRFIDADRYVMGVPMWNGGIPYRLKQYIDIITQPGLLFGFDPVTGYHGLLQNKKATVVYTSGVYAPGVPAAFGQDFQATYLDWWLRFIGVTDIRTIRYQPTLLTDDPERGFEDALLAVTEAAGEIQ